MGTGTLPLDMQADADLLTCFAERRDEAAFAEIVRRHGPAVRSACRRSLGDTPDADDAFQAVFLILARKAGTLRNAGLLGLWLHTVAVRSAGRARLLARRRQARERQVMDMPEPAGASAPEPNDWLPLLDAEIERLPNRLRTPLLLCELQGMSRSDAARELDIPEGTLSSRLARGRDLLRKRLQRRGVFVESAALTVAVFCWSEALPASLVTETTSTALTGVTSASVAALTQGVLKTMMLVKLKLAAIALLTLGVATGALFAGRNALVQADDAKAEKGGDAKADKDRLQGKWEIVTAQSEGKDAEDEDAKEILKKRIVFEGDKVRVKKEGTYTIDPAKKPKQIDWKIEVGPEHERGTWKGIYELNGDDLKICIGPPSADRPTEFVTKEEDDPKKALILFKLKRVK